VLLGQHAIQPLRRCEQPETGKLHINRDSHARTLGEETDEGDQGDSKFANLLDNALDCAIGPCCDDPVVNPPGTEDTANRLQDVKGEKRELS
jgi:hypothetical protein